MGIQEQFNKIQVPLSIWPPYVDFEIGGHKVKVVGVGADETRNFGSTLNGRVWSNELEKTRCTAFVLASWFPPYVDIVGWLTRERLATMREHNWFVIQEAVVEPITTLRRS